MGWILFGILLVLLGDSARGEHEDSINVVWLALTSIGLVLIFAQASAWLG